MLPLSFSIKLMVARRTSARRASSACVHPRPSRAWRTRFRITIAVIGIMMRLFYSMLPNESRGLRSLRGPMCTVLPYNDDVDMKNVSPDRQRASALAALVTTLMKRANLKDGPLGKRAELAPGTVKSLRLGHDSRHKPVKPNPDTLRHLARGLAYDASVEEVE